MMDARYHADPDVLALRSVSLSAKLAITKQRKRDEMWSQLDVLHAREVARRAFFSNRENMKQYADNGGPPFA